MLVDMPAAQHKTMFFIVSLNVHVFIDTYLVAGAVTTALQRLCVGYHKEITPTLKPVTFRVNDVLVKRRQGENEEEPFRPGQLPLLTLRE